MTTQEQPQARTWTEAPASATIRALDPAGFDVLLTLRGDSGAELLPRLSSAVDWLRAQGYTPVRNGHQEAAQQQTGDTESDVLTDDRGKRYKVCAKHDAKMYEKTGKDGQRWYSHQLADGTWCKG